MATIRLEEISVHTYSIVGETNFKPISRQLMGVGSRKDCINSNTTEIICAVISLFVYLIPINLKTTNSLKTTIEQHYNEIKISIAKGYKANNKSVLRSVVLVLILVDQSNTSGVVSLLLYQHKKMKYFHINIFFLKKN